MSGVDRVRLYPRYGFGLSPGLSSCQAPLKSLGLTRMTFSLVAEATAVLLFKKVSFTRGR